MLAIAAFGLGTEGLRAAPVPVRDSKANAFASAAQPDPSGKPGAAGRDDAQDSLRCLTLAVAYEAGNQPREGQQAVAEVVLNRLAHAAFPKTVCGVVFQGWQRGRGCQFTFVCDGALTRRLSDQTIITARTVAMGAMAAGAPRLVAGALNYHAHYVSPIWAGNLTRVARIGAHIFYRPLPGGSAEGAFAGSDDKADGAGQSLWAQPDHAAIVRAYGRYSKLDGPVAAAPGKSELVVAAQQTAPHEPQIFAPWGLAVR